ncbi:hypothetical protein CERSUDRAFT_111944 [Gelatoporia subvermispora B]|uniref:Oxidase ustYa n=1 Tax=Ceriporiopsis subvermispora (strain B) TaxID=914234 RepID=M2RMD7_CERS8|nr:hypothetical protein CERSUDRAFT_111944 [Gelatoporia subvermispora B]
MLPSQSTLSSRFVLGCIAALSLVTIFNVGFTWYNIVVLKQLMPTQRDYTYIGDDWPAQLPLRLPEVGLVLESGDDHFSLYDDEEWGTLFPSEGFTDLGPRNRTFLLSMIHQMHCLDVIRVGFVTNRTGAAHHIEHCLRYLRQMVLCYADTTLEDDMPAILDGKWEHGSSGVGSVHRCRDWTVLRKYLLEYPASDYVPE